MQRRKLVIVGDGFCGKTALLLRYTENRFIDLPDGAYTPTIFENDMVVTTVDRKQIELSLWDTAGQEDFETLRPLSYADVDVILMCFSVDFPDSLENIETKWIPEVKQYCPFVPYILVATKLDLRYDDQVMNNLSRRNMRPVNYEDGEYRSRQVKAYDYYETSAKTGEGVKQLFQTAARVAVYNGKGLKQLRRFTRCCCVL